MDLKDLVPTSDLVEVKLAHPSTGEPLFNDDETRMSITVYAPFSKTYKSIMFDKTKSRIKDRLEDFDMVELEELSIDVLSETTKEWNITFGGEKPEVSVQKAKELYTDAFWIKSQIEEAIKSSLDFTKA
jgi:hypothetical protein